MAFAGDEHVLVALEDDFDGSSGGVCEEGCPDGAPAALGFFASESSAEVSCFDFDLVVGEVEGLGGEVLYF